MAATNYDILDLVATAVCHLTGKTPDVVLAGNNILINGKPVSIADIKATIHGAKRFMKLIKGVV